MANAIPVHSSSKKGKPANEVKDSGPVPSSEVESAGPVQPSEGPVLLEVVDPRGFKLESHSAFRMDH